MVNYKSKLDILLYIIIADLVLGGAGRYLVVGGVSARMFIFVIALIILVVQIFTKHKGEIVYTKLYIPYGLLFLSFAISTIIGLVSNNRSNVLLTVSGYTYFLFFVYFIQNVRSKELAVKLFVFFNKLVVVLSCVSIVLYVLLFVYGVQFYAFFNSALTDNAFGALGLIGTRLPRVFLKCSVFMPMTLVYYISEYLRKEEKQTQNLICLLLVFFGLLSTETIGFWAAFLFGGLILVIVIRKTIKIKRLIILFGLFIVLSGGYSAFYGYASNAHINQNDNVSDVKVKQNIIAARLNKEDKSTSIKLVQGEALLSASSKHILFGNGLGKVVDVNAGDTHRQSTRFEIMWLELLMNNGLFGLITYAALIVFILKMLLVNISLKDIEATNVSVSIAIGLVMMVLVNFSNPFLNNPIGIGYLILCASVANVINKEMKKSKQKTF